MPAPLSSYIFSFWHKYRPLFVRYLIPMGVVALVTGVFIYAGGSSVLPQVSYDLAAFEQRTPFRYEGSFERDFNDLQDVQLPTAERIGIAPLASAADAEALGDALVCLSASSPLYVLDSLTHSIPYLIPVAVELLDDIGSAFAEHLEQHGLPLYRPIVTSVLRTDESIKRLQRSNVNATARSTHLFGTTFDITWKRYDKVDPADPRLLSPSELKQHLAAVLVVLHRDGRCYIKHEKKQACFHITVRR